jgi:hypothetical protein
LTFGTPKSEIQRELEKDQFTALCLTDKGRVYFAYKAPEDEKEVDHIYIDLKNNKTTVDDKHNQTPGTRKLLDFLIRNKIIDKSFDIKTKSIFFKTENEPDFDFFEIQETL